MTVKELIEKLKTMPQDAKIKTFGQSEYNASNVIDAEVSNTNQYGKECEPYIFFYTEE